MCDVCLKSPCDPRCPNAPEPKAVFICSECGTNIVAGEDVWHVLGETYCEKCIDSFRSTAEPIEDY